MGDPGAAGGGVWSSTTGWPVRKSMYCGVAGEVGVGVCDEEEAVGVARPLVGKLVIPL